jgi:hypothetical protein
MQVSIMKSQKHYPSRLRRWAAFAAFVILSPFRFVGWLGSSLKEEQRRYEQLTDEEKYQEWVDNQW